MRMVRAPMRSRTASRRVTGRLELARGRRPRVTDGGCAAHGRATRDDVRCPSRRRSPRSPSRRRRPPASAGQVLRSAGRPRYASWRRARGEPSPRRDGGPPSHSIGLRREPALGRQGRRLRSRASPLHHETQSHVEDGDGEGRGQRCDAQGCSHRRPSRVLRLRRSCPDAQRLERGDRHELVAGRQSVAIPALARRPDVSRCGLAALAW